MRFLLDLPLNTHPVSLIQPQTYFTPTILENLIHFFLKIDMALTDPAHAPYSDNHRNPSLHPARHVNGAPSGVAVRKLLIAERRVTSLSRVLRGLSWNPAQGRTEGMMKLDV